MSCNLYKLLVQVETCTGFLYKLQLVQNLNLYITHIYIYITSRRSCDLDIQDVISKLEKIYSEHKLKAKLELQEAKFNKDFHQLKNLF